MKRQTLCHFLVLVGVASSVWAADVPSPKSVAEQIDAQIIAGDSATNLSVAEDATFLRRLSLDLIGRPPSAGEITRFGLNPSETKRQDLIRDLLATDEYASNWSRYWRDALFSRATNVRAALVQPAFEEWMHDNFAQNRPWDEVVTDLITATGSVNDNGATALIFAHEGEPEEIAAEASRLFLGIQIQCANCHNHPWDRWKREQFHEFVAFFPRITLRRDPASDNMFDYEITSANQDRSRRQSISTFVLSRMDRNRDEIISEAEAKGTMLERLFTGPAKDVIDANGDGQFTFEEIRTAQPPDNNRPGQGTIEHHMADLSDPGSEGKLIHPAFFVSDTHVRKGQDDLSRRKAAASLITSRDNPWFARAMVNRMWAEFTGTAFYLPVDDLGPDRHAEHEDALATLCDGFVASGYDVQWLVSTIASTKLYQRSINTSAEGFLKLEPTRMRSDQLYDALCQTLNVTALPLRFTSGRRVPYARNQDYGRSQFADTFGFDPSTPKTEVTGSIPEALFMMNSPELHNFVKADSPNSTIARISRQVLSDEDVIRELYLTTVGREPKASEIKICTEHIAAAASRREGLEDILWSLLNSTEYQSKS